MTDHAVVDAGTWREARLELLEREKALTREREAVAAARRDLPWVELTEPYAFAGRDGERSLVDLFDGRSQLLVWHFMMGPDWTEGCPMCSFWADGYDGTLAHLAARDTSLVVVSRAPVEAIEAYRARMGWSFPWYSSLGSSFNFDLGVSFTAEQVASGEPLYNFGTIPPGEEMPGLSVLRRDGARMFLTYQTFARGLDWLNVTYQHLDLTSRGRDEDGLPWSMAWVHRHDAYPDDRA